MPSAVCGYKMVWSQMGWPALWLGACHLLFLPICRFPSPVRWEHLDICPTFSVGKKKGHTVKQFDKLHYIKYRDYNFSYYHICIHDGFSFWAAIFHIKLSWGGEKSYSSMFWCWAGGVNLQIADRNTIFPPLCPWTSSYYTHDSW